MLIAFYNKQLEREVGQRKDGKRATTPKAETTQLEEQTRVSN